MNYDLKVLVSYAGTVTEYSARVTMQGTDSTEPSGAGAPGNCIIS